MNSKKWKILAIVLVVAMALGSVDLKTTVFAEEIVNENAVEPGSDIESVGEAEANNEAVVQSAEQTVHTSEELVEKITNATGDTVIVLAGTPAEGTSEVVFELTETLCIPAGVSVTIKGTTGNTYRLQAKAVTVNSAVINIPADTGSILNLENVVVDANQSGRVVYNAGTLNVTDSSLENGLATTSLTSGIGIYNTGTVTLNSGAVVQNNSSTVNKSVSGIGIYNTGTLTMNGNSAVQRNKVTITSGSNKSIQGVGIYIGSDSKVTLNGSSICENQLISETPGSSGVKAAGIGVYIEASSGTSFHMNDGSISNNSVSGDLKSTKGTIEGVGCYTNSISADICFYGGTITGNRFSEAIALNKSGAGLFVNQTFKIGGNLQIIDNDTDNLYFGNSLLAAAQRLTVGKRMESGACIDCSFVKESGTLPHTLFVGGTDEDGNYLLSDDDIQYFYYRGVNANTDLGKMADALYMMNIGEDEAGKVVMQIVSVPSVGGEVAVSNEDELKRAITFSSTDAEDKTQIILQNDIEIREPLNIASGRQVEITSAVVGGEQKNYSISIADGANSMETLLTTRGSLKLSHVELDANGKARVVSADVGAEVIISEGATVTGGYLNTNGAEGSGLKIAIGASATLEDGGAITGNKAIGNYNQNTVKGIGVYNAGTFTMTGGSITANTVTDLTTTGVTGGVNGGALYNDGSGSAKGVFTISGGTIAGNTANNSGGAIYNSSASTENVLSDVTIENNRAVLYYINDESNYYGTNGGAIYTNAGTITISGSTAIRNNQALNGGGLYITGTSTAGNTGYGTVIMDGENVSVTDNQLLTETGYGAGIFLDSAKLTINAGKISENKIPDLSIVSEWYQGLGGGIYVNGDKKDTSTSMGTGNAVIPATLELFGGEITGNTAVNGGSGIYVSNIAIAYDHLRNETTPKYGAALVKVKGSPVVKNNVKDDIRLGAAELIDADDESNTPSVQTLTIMEALGENAQLNVFKKICTYENDYAQSVEDNAFAVAGDDYLLTDADINALFCKVLNDDGLYQFAKESMEGAEGYQSVSVPKVSEDLLSVTLEGENGGYTYTGSAIEPKVAVAIGEETLADDRDYMVEYADNTEVGTASVIITGQGKYTGTYTKTFEIMPKKLVDPADGEPGGSEISPSSPITLDTDKLTYDGTAQIPVITIKDGNYTLVEGTDYIVTCDDCTTPGEKTLTVTGIGNYEGTSFTRTFTIEKASIATATVSGLNNAVYNGSPITWKLTVKDANQNTLTENKDYIVSYDRNVEAGTASVTITGTGNYTDSIQKTFTIAKASQTISNEKLSGKTISGGTVTWTYSSKGATLTATAKGAVTYSSSQPTVATINSKTGKITYKKAGTTTITINAASTQNYNAATKTIKLTTKRAAQKITVTKTSRSYKASKLKIKKATFKIGAKRKIGNGKLTYKVTKYPKKAKKYISVSKTGKVTMKKNAKKGTYKVTVTAAKTTKYNKATKVITIKVK